MAFAAWAEIMIGAMIIIVKVIYKMILHVIRQFSFDGDHRKIDVNSRKGIPQMQKMMEIRVPVFLRKCNIVGDVEVSCVRLK